MTQEELMHWFDGLIKQVEAGELTVSACLTNEGIHDCVDFEFDNVENLEKDGISYYPQFIMIYAPTPEAFALEGWEASGHRSSGKFSHVQSMTSDGFWKGLLLSETAYPEMYEKVCRLAEETIEKKRA